MSAKSKHKVISCEAVHYECGICLREFSTSWCLQMHIKTHSEQNSFDCHECGMTYPDFSALCEHLKVHIFGADPVEQDTEPPIMSGYHDPVSLTEGDQMSQISKPQLTCVNCEKSFGSFKALKLHSRIHKTKKVVETEELSTGKTRGTIRFDSNQGGIEEEESQNVKTKRGRPKKNKNTPPAHFLKVGKKYRCEVCAKKLSSRSLMEKHILKHQTGQFHCSRCDRDFSTRSGLKDHEKFHESADKPPTPHVVLVEDHVKAVELVVEDEKGFSCIVCEKTFNNKQKAHVHILCHKKRKGRLKLKMSKKQHSNSISDASPRRKDVSDLQENVGVDSSHMTPGPANTSQSVCCGECKEQFGTQEELVDHQNLHIRDHTMALMRILKPGTNLNVSIAETQTLLNAVHSASDLVQATNKETTSRNTSSQHQVSPAILHPENCQPVKATESTSQQNLLKAFPSVQCNAKVVLERLENETLLVRNGGGRVSRYSKKHRIERDNSVQHRKSGENATWADRAIHCNRPKKLDRTEDTVRETGAGHKTEETLCDNNNLLQEGGDYSDDGDNDTFHDEDDIDHVDNDHYSVSAKGSTDLMTSEPAQDLATAEDEREMSAESPHTSESAKNVHNTVLTKDLVSTETNSKRETAKLSSLAKSILENVVKKGDMFSCRICEAEFTELQKAKNHVRVHVSRRRFECKFCPAKFVYASKLLSHETTHMSQKLSAETKTRLTTRCHYKIVGKEFICNICNKWFMTKHKVQCHVRYHLLEDTYQCRFCQKCFRKKYSLYNHEKTHPEASGEGSKNASMDDRHVEDGEPKEVKLKFKRGKYKEYIEPGNDILKCKLCESTFKNNKQIIDHFRSHFAERKFWCPICSAAFKRNTHLDVHMKAHDRGNIKMTKVRISEGVKESINAEKNKDVKINPENNRKDGVELSADVPIHTQGTEDQGEAGSYGLQELPLGGPQSDTLDNVPVNANKEQQASVAKLPQEDQSCSNVAGDKTSTADENLRNSSCSRHPTSTTAEIVTRPPLTQADGASVSCRSPDKEGHLLAELSESTVTSAEVPKEKETLSHTEREIPDDRSAVTVDLSDGGDGDGEQKDMTQTVAAAVTACVKDGTKTDPKVQTNPDTDTVTVHGLGVSESPNKSGEVEMLPTASDDDDDGGMIHDDDVSDDNDCDSDFQYEPDMDCDSDISSENGSPARTGIPTVKYLYESPADCIADEREIEEPNINMSSGSKNQAGPSKNEQDAIQPELCSPNKKKSKSSNKPTLKDKAVTSKERGRRVITQDTSVKMTQLMRPIEKLKKKIIKCQGQEGDSDLHHEDENHQCHVGPKTSETEEECSLMETASSDSSFAPQMYQTEYTIEAGGSFRCAFCDKVFKSLLSIKNHLSVEHDLFRCKTCIAAFQTHQELKKHNEENKHLQLRVLSNRNIASKMEIVRGYLNALFV
ncbi:zinc finger protein Xfin-like [Haliotis rubra]|uniref:zinc finger protein Xfin-like n=1 Tax=Haliotis rubra TaxID=36100 RepID=UPI001EE598A2|nr:zinc finger protein Xfin-like [Haliotis rubra]